MAAWFTKEKYEGGPDSARCLELLVDAATLGGGHQEVKEHSALQPMSVEYTLLPEIKLIKAVQTVLVCAMHLAGQVCVYTPQRSRHPPTF